MNCIYRKIFLVIGFIMLVSVFIAGCTAPSVLRGSIAGTVLYTDCPPDEVFEIACLTVARQGYEIDIKNDFNHFVRGYSKDALSDRKNFYVHIEVEPQPVGSKVISRLDEFHDTKKMKFLGIYSSFANRLANEISSNLTKRNYQVQRL